MLFFSSLIYDNLKKNISITSVYGLKGTGQLTSYITAGVFPHLFINQRQQGNLPAIVFIFLKSITRLYCDIEVLHNSWTNRHTATVAPTLLGTTHVCV